MSTLGGWIGHAAIYGVCLLGVAAVLVFVVEWFATSSWHAPEERVVSISLRDIDERDDKAA